MTITPKNATTVTINGVDFLLSAITVVVSEQRYLQVIKNSDQSDIIPKTYYKNLTDGTDGQKYTSVADFLSGVSAGFGYTGAGVKQGAAVPNSAGAPSAAYVQAEAVAALAELRALKTSLVNAGIIKA